MTTTQIIETSDGAVAHVQHSDIKLVLATLGHEWQRVRAARNAEYPPSEDPGICRYCNKPWANWKGTKLDGHALCTAPRDFMQLVIDSINRPDCRYIDVAEALDVTPSVIRAWWRTLTVRGMSNAGSGRRFTGSET